jgi:hypothetical protein
MKHVCTALLEAKKEIGKVAKNAKNPHFKNTYADINALIEAVEPILLDKGLLLLQPINDGKVSSIVIHAESGEQMQSTIDLPMSGTPQQLGSAITYYRRYTLQSLLSLQAEDDDANAASNVKPAPAKKKTITMENFAIGLDKVNKGELMFFKFEDTLKQYDLTPEQIAMVKSARENEQLKNEQQKAK